ncbi:DNA-directed RNA polymerase subunit RPC12/RpoP [Rhizobium mongolense]
MSGRNFEKDRQRRTVADRGHEHFHGGMPLIGVPRPKPSRDQLRLDLDEAMASVTQIKRVLKCVPCGHQFIELQPIDPPFPPAVCPRCGGAV